MMQRTNCGSDALSFSISSDREWLKCEVTLATAFLLIAKMCQQIMAKKKTSKGAFGMALRLKIRSPVEGLREMFYVGALKFSWHWRSLEEPKK